VVGKDLYGERQRVKAERAEAESGVAGLEPLPGSEASGIDPESSATTSGTSAPTTSALTTSALTTEVEVAAEVAVDGAPPDNGKPARYPVAPTSPDVEPTPEH
jgi:hypothetical protein